MFATRAYNTLYQRRETSWWSHSIFRRDLAEYWLQLTSSLSSGQSLRELQISEGSRQVPLGLQ